MIAAPPKHTAWHWASALFATSALLLTAAIARAGDQSIIPPHLASDQPTRVAYPAAAGEATARVVLQLHIDAKGRVQSTEPVEVAIEPSSTDPTPFIQSAEKKALELQFEPAQRNNQPVSSLIRFAFQITPPAPVESAAAPLPVREPVPEPEPAQPPPTFSAHAALPSEPPLPSPQAASDLTLDLSALRAVPRQQAKDYLTLAPGVVLTNHSGEGHAGGIFLRGFDAGEGQDLELRVDGIPLNEPSNAHSHGYADTQFLIPEVIDRVRVLEGPFDPRQSDFAVAGSASYELGVTERGLRAQLGYGRFAEKRALLLWAPTGADRGTFAAVDLRDGDGFGPNRAHSSTNALARYADAAEALHYSVLLASHAAEFDSAGVIREDDYRTRDLPCAEDRDVQFFCVSDPQQGGSTARHLLNAKLGWRRPDRSFELQAFGMLRNLRVRENFTGALLDERGDGLDESYEATTVGARASYTLTPKLWNRSQRLELGLEARHDDGETSALRIRRASGIPYATVFDSELALTHIGAYVLGELHPIAAVSFRGGVRLDGFAFHTLDRAAPGEDRVGPRLPILPRDAFGSAVSPRGSVVGHLTRNLDWTLSAGLGVRSSDAQALSEGEAAPFARALSLETGPTARARLYGVDLDARAFAFATRVENDLLFDATRGRNVPIGPSNRYGASASARARIGTQHDTLASVTWTEAHRIARDDGIFALGTGPRLPFVPRWVARLDHASNAELSLGAERLQLGAALGLTWIGAQPLPLGTESQARFQIDLALRARLRFVELGFSVQNLLDRRNHAAELNYASHFGDADDPTSMRSVRHFAAATPRLWMLTVTGYLDDVAAVLGDES